MIGRMKNGAASRGLYALKSAQKALSGMQKTLPALSRAEELIRKRKGEIIVTGIGKSGYIGQKIAATLTSLGQRALFLHPAEAIHGDIGALSKGDVVVALSYSGESKEVVRIVRYAKANFNVSVVAMCKSRSSSLGKLADCCIEVSVRHEGSPNELAPMASTTATLVLGDMLAAMLTEPNFKEGHFAKFHPGGALGLKFKHAGQSMRSGAAMPLVREDAPLPAVLRIISSKKLGATGVLDSKGGLSGIVTDGDIRRFLLRNKGVEGARARDLMTKRPKHITESASLAEALELMERHKITHLFVVTKARRPIGILHIHDIVEGAFPA
jgi:arabinose-5-phosphate isomerase